jgi:hypothetical protein
MVLYLRVEWQSCHQTHCQLCLSWLRDEREGVAVLQVDGQTVSREAGVKGNIAATSL